MRRYAPALVAVLVLVLTGSARALSPPPGGLSADATVRLALAQSPAVRAAQSRLEAATAGLRGARAPHGLQVELAPGVGFTNGNSLLALPLDIAGLRPAQVRVAGGEREAAAASLHQARLQAAAEARVAFFDLARARAAESAATEAADLARQVQEIVRRRVELGEAPAVQATRARIEVARAEQEAVRARGEARGRLGALNLLLGRAPQAATILSEGLTLPAVPASTARLRERALQQRPDLAALRALVAARQGDVAVARARRRPTLSAELASDIWSLDRGDPFQSRDLGFQARLTFPLFEQTRLGADVDRASALARAQEADLAAGLRAVEVEIERAQADADAAREVALGYQQAILPQTEELLTATRSGFASGLVSFAEVLDAQRVVRQTRTEYLSALYEAVRAAAALDVAVGNLPNGVSSPLPVPPKETRP